MNNLEEKILQIPIEDIIPNRFQPRLAFDDDALNDLAASIKQHGIIQPLVVRRLADKYEIIAGERRYKAAVIAGLISVPAIVNQLDDNKSAEVAIVENVQRKSLSAIEEAKSYKALLDKGYMTQEDLAKKMGLSQSAISNKLRLLTLNEAVQDAVIHEKISERHARSLLKIQNSEEQLNMLNKIINERLTVKQLEEEIKKMNINTAPVQEIETPVVNSIESQPSEQNNMYNNPQQMANKFFHFLEDESANMSVTEEPKVSPFVYNPQELQVIQQEKTAETNEISLNVNNENNISNNQNVIENTSSMNNTQSNEQVEEIEMLDFDVPAATPIIVPEEKTAETNDITNETINKIRSLNLTSDKIIVEEINLPNEYLINIRIKK